MALTPLSVLSIIHQLDELKISREPSRQTLATAWHEAGHAVVCALYNFYDRELPQLTEVNIAPDFERLGIARRLFNGCYIVSNEIEFYMAGAAAEYLGGFCSWFGESDGLSWWKDRSQATELLIEQNEEIQKEEVDLALEKYYDRAYRLLKKNKPILEIVVNELMYKYRLHGSRVDTVVSHHIRKKWLDEKKFVDNSPPLEAWPANGTFGEKMVFALTYRPPEEVLRERWMSEKFKQ